MAGNRIGAPTRAKHETRFQPNKVEGLGLKIPTEEVLGFRA